MKDLTKDALVCVIGYALRTVNCNICGGEAEQEESDFLEETKHEEGCPVSVVAQALNEEGVDFYKILEEED